MKLFIAILTTLALSGTVIAAQNDNSVAAASSNLICKTTSGSPLLSDVQSAADKLSKQGQQKCPTSKNGGCNQIATSGTAAADVCGPNGWYVACYNAGRYILQLADKCKANVGGAMRVGGTYQDGDGKGSITVHQA